MPLRYYIQIPLIIILLLVIAGCANNGTLVVLAPDSDGKTGAVTVSNQAGTVDIDSPNQVTFVTNSQKSPTPPASISKDTLIALFSEALSIEPKPPVHYLLYFEKDLILTLESARLFPEILQAISDRASSDISVVGHTDSVGSREYNLTLSRNRANSVRDKLVDKGVAANHIKTTSHGKENPLIKTEDNVNEPRNRRVEVVIR
ncbi:OmpA family protein [Geobacter pelophilus]|uniref:OmpA family protein n=1 Tax=Geoanaerobacter pelophilus TaxID=60036 RepID=A0AAW4L1N6_9BACT|nr:OmpA family protein [Geoanaerobacter pelophilus]MBT0662888.1 OmpA family protein [Geoanaerobacter pelophilus]